MIVLPYIDMAFVGPDVIKGGLKDIGAEVIDDEGRLSVPTAKIKLCNINGYYNNIISQPDPCPELWVEVNTHTLFKGKLMNSGLLYDPNDLSLEMNFVSYYSEFLNNCKLVKLRDVGVASVILPFNGSADNLTATNFRQFFKITNLLERIVRAADSGIRDVNIDGLTDWYIGGKHYTEENELLPDMTGYDFIKSIIEIMNGIWQIDFDHNFTFKPKADILADAATMPAIGFNALKGTRKLVNNVVNIDAVELGYTNKIDGDSQKTYAKIVRRSPPRNLKTITPAFIIPYREGLLEAWLHYNNSPNNCLITSTGDLYTYQQKPITASNILSRYFSCELNIGKSLEFTASILNNTAILQEWPLMFRKIAVSGETDLYTYQVSIDPYQETLNLKALGYGTN